MKEKWSEQAWRAVEPVYRQILSHPFVTGLVAGTLERSKFLFYLSQDALYLGRYCKVLAHVGSRLDNRADIEAMMRFASDGIAVEAALHESFLGGEPLPAMSPTCMLYTAVEEAQAFRPVEVEAAALLPCFWVYDRVGRSILEQCGDSVDSNPYARWIKTYGDPTFAEATRRYIDICDRLADGATDAIRAEMTEIFKTCTRLEWMFWDSAYHLEKWKI